MESLDQSLVVERNSLAAPPTGLGAKILPPRGVWDAWSLVPTRGTIPGSWQSRTDHLTDTLK